MPAPADDLSLAATDFALFGLPPRFALDAAALEAAWKRLQGSAHPDRFAADGAAAQRLAMQWSIRINEAYRRLKDPLQRAAYLCTLAGTEIGAENNTAMPPAFLMQQMAWREALDEAVGLAAVEALEAAVAQAREHSLQQLARQIDETVPIAWPAVAQTVRGLMFVDRFAQDIARRIDTLSD